MYTFDDWNIFEKFLLTISLVVLVIVSIIFKSDWLVTIYSITGVIMTLLLAKGKVSGQLVGIITTILYLILSFSQKYYGEVIIYAGVMFPLRIVSMVSWLKNQDKNDDVVKVSVFKPKEWIQLLLIFIFTSFIFFFLLKAFDTRQLIVSVMSAVTAIFAAYLLAIRNKHGFTFFIINDLIIFVLWIIPIIKGDLSLLPVIVTCVIFLINDLYGIYNWEKIKQEQTKAVEI